MRPTLLLRVFLSTTVAMTVLFAGAGWFLLRQASEALAASVEEEVRGSLASVEALWRARGDMMRNSSALLSTMSDVRAAFGTRDPATIEDTAAEIWARGASPDTLLLVAGAQDGAILAALGRGPKIASRQLPPGWLETARKSFPRQATGFALWNGMLWQVAVTPVYVDAAVDNPLLLNILVAAEPIGVTTLERLQRDTGGTSFVLTAGGAVIAETPSGSSHRAVARPLELKGMDATPLGTLVARRTLELAETRLASLRSTIVAGWMAAMIGGLLLSFWFTRRITQPIKELERAALEVSRENYSVRVAESSSRDELGLLAKTFNRMCDSIQNARAELIRREQIHAAGRLGASIAHDLRNPLSAVTGGAEMLAEMELPPEQARRAAKNVHSAAMRMHHMLEELSESVRRTPPTRTSEDLLRIVQSAVQTQQEKLTVRGIETFVEVPDGLRVMVERSRFERVIINLLGNACEAMQGAGWIRITASREGGEAVVEILDNGPGIPPEIRAELFQPFVTQGKKSGLGLGLALSRQTMLDHRGDLTVVYSGSAPGACFRLRVPVVEKTARPQ